MNQRQDYRFPSSRPDKRPRYDDRHAGHRNREGNNGNYAPRFDNRNGRAPPQPPTPRVEIRCIPADSFPRISHVSNEYMEAINLAKGTPGTVGKVDALITNYVYAQVPLGDIVLHQYSMVTKKLSDMQTELGTSKAFNNLMLRKLKSNHPDLESLKYVFDGGDLFYSCDKIENIAADVDGIQIEIKWVKSISLSELTGEVLQVLNVALRHSLRKLGRINIGRNQYNYHASKSVPNQPVVILPGFKSTLTPTSLGLLYTSDVIFKSLRTDTILDMLHKLSKRYRDGELLETEFKRAVVGRIVFLTYSRKTVTITGVAFDKNPMSKFFLTKQDREITYRDYYKQSYGETITNLQQPLLICQRKHKTQEEYFIPELCQMTGLTDDLKNDNKAKRDMKAIVDISAAERMQRIQEDIKLCLDNADFKEELSAMKIELNPDLIAVKARVLPVGRIQFGGQRFELPNEKVEWRIMNQEPYKHFDLRNWLVIWDGNGPQNAIKDWISCAKRIANQMNVRFSEPMVEVVRSRDFTKQVREILSDYERTQIAVIVVPHGDEGTYYELKRICLEDLGIPSQCLHPNKVMKANMSVVTKVVIQMICKVGGAPWKIDLAEKSLENTMICGLDLHHSGEHVEHKFKKKSVVGFVATLGRSHTTFSSGVSIQDSGTDIAQVVTPLFKRALLAYHKHNGKYPEHVLIYRDGVGITEINKVRQTEWSDIIDLLMDISENKAPDMPPTTELDPVINFNYVVVLKHIQTRFVRAEGGYGNPSAGTVVDVDITLPGVLEFFLIAHHASPGSSAPTRYQVHQNESNFDANFYQNTTNKLCSMYYNWFGAIRSPAHCQYAKVLAKLIGQAEIKKDHQDLSNRLFFL